MALVLIVAEMKQRIESRQAYMYLVRNLCDSEIGFKFNHEMSQTWHIFSFRCLMNYYCVPWVISSTYSVNKKQKQKKSQKKGEPNREIHNHRSKTN